MAVFDQSGQKVVKMVDLRNCLSSFVLFGVGGGIRTLGHWNHNPALYQLSYTHRKDCISLNINRFHVWLQVIKVRLYAQFMAI